MLPVALRFGPAAPRARPKRRAPDLGPPSSAKPGARGDDAKPVARGDHRRQLAPALALRVVELDRGDRLACPSRAARPDGDHAACHGGGAEAAARGQQRRQVAPAGGSWWRSARPCSGSSLVAAAEHEDLLTDRGGGDVLARDLHPRGGAPRSGRRVVDLDHGQGLARKGAADRVQAAADRDQHVGGARRRPRARASSRSPKRGRSSEGRRTRP